MVPASGEVAAGEANIADFGNGAVAVVVTTTVEEPTPTPTVASGRFSRGQQTALRTATSTHAKNK